MQVGDHRFAALRQPRKRDFYGDDDRGDHQNDEKPHVRAATCEGDHQLHHAHAPDNRASDQQTRQSRVLNLLVRQKSGVLQRLLVRFAGCAETRILEDRSGFIRALEPV